MKKKLFSVSVASIMLLLLFSPEFAFPQKAREGSRKQTIDHDKIESDVIGTFRTMISLWKDEKYEALYEHGDKKSRASIRKEDFEHRMKNKEVGLASSWETIKDVRVEVESATRVHTRAKIGYKSKKGGDTKHRTETFLMTLEKGAWKIDLQKILRAKI